MRYAACLTVLLAPGLATAADVAGGRQAWERLFSQDQPAAATAQIDAVLGACNHDAEKLKALIASDTAYPQMKAAWHRRSTRVQAGAKPYDVEFLVRVPAGYTPKKSWPLLLIAHGQNSDGGHIMAAFDRRLGPAIEQFVVVAPTMPGPQGFRAQEYQQQSYLKPLAWTRVHLNIDDDRIYLSGYSQGAHLVWNLSGMFPHHFAAALPMAGAPIFEGFPATATAYLQNLANLPVWAIWGEWDKPPPPKQGNADFCRLATKRLKALRIKTYRATELKGKAHGGCWPSGREIVEFLQAHKRRAVPEKDWHYFHLAHHKRSYYVEALKFAHPPFDFMKGAEIKLPAGVKPTQELMKREYEKIVRAAVFRLYATLDRPRNTLRIQPLGIRAVRLYVMAGMFDLAKPVRLHYFGRTWRGRIGVSAKCMLHHYAATRDATALVYNEIDLFVTGKAVVRYK